MSKAPQIWRIATIVFTHLVGYEYSCPIETLIFFCANIGTDTPISISHDSDPMSWWSQNSRKLARVSEIWRVTTMFFSNIL